jgi:hypothetical protein
MKRCKCRKPGKFIKRNPSFQNRSHKLMKKEIGIPAAAACPIFAIAALIGT